MGRSVGCDLPQHVAEKFSKKNTFLYISYISATSAREGKRSRFSFFLFVSPCRTDHHA
jgi:hypothetical protein